MAPESAFFLGRYQIIRLLGQGGMGAVYLARDPAIGREVAVKLLERIDDEEMRRRFAREARAVGRLKHQNIVTIHDMGEHGNQSYIVMEYLQGETLQQLICRKAPLSITRKLQLVGELCAGLAHAHGAGIIHRDVKPSNVIVDDAGVVKIVDFGIAKAAGTGITKAGSIPGTLNYLSPELIATGTIDHRTDMFAAGAVLYELLAYQQAFPGTVHDGVLRRIVVDNPPGLREVCRDVDVDLEKVVARALAKRPEDRYPDLSAMRAEVERHRSRLESAESTVVRPRPAVLTTVDEHSAIAQLTTSGASIPKVGAGWSPAPEAETVPSPPRRLQTPPTASGLEPQPAIAAHPTPAATQSEAKSGPAPALGGKTFGTDEARVWAFLLVAAVVVAFVGGILILLLPMLESSPAPVALAPAMGQQGVAPVTASSPTRGQQAGTPPGPPRVIPSGPKFPETLTPVPELSVPPPTPTVTPPAADPGTPQSTGPLSRTTEPSVPPPAPPLPSWDRVVSSVGRFSNLKSFTLETEYMLEGRLIRRSYFGVNLDSAATRFSGRCRQETHNDGKRVDVAIQTPEGSYHPDAGPGNQTWVPDSSPKWCLVTATFEPFFNDYEEELNYSGGLLPQFVGVCGAGVPRLCFKGPSRNLWYIDPDSSLPVAYESSKFGNCSLTDFRSVGSYRLPFEVVCSGAGLLKLGPMRHTVKRFEVNPLLDVRLFDVPGR